MKRHKLALICSFAFIANCSHSADATAKPAAVDPIVANAAGSDPSLAKASGDEEERVPLEPFSDAKRNFDTVKDTLLKEYYREGISEEDIYRAAVQGILEHVDPKMKKWNKLLSPADLADMNADSKGEIIGIGVQIRFDHESGYTDVLGTTSHSAAEKAGVVAGDKIVSVNGKLYKGKNVRDVIADIRGKVGEMASVVVLRGDKLLTFSMPREAVAFDSVTEMMLPDHVCYIRIRSFTEKTVAMLKTALGDAANKNASAIVVDLRHNQGGLFDEAIHSAELFVPRGSEISSLKKRDQHEEKFVSNSAPLLASLPVAVLVDHSTSSGAELMTAALQESRHAQIVGQRTFGKWSVQRVDDLSNGYAIKWTTGLFYSPSHQNFEGVGLLPDVEVDMDEALVEQSQAIINPEKRLTNDAQLRTAVSLVKMHL